MITREEYFPFGETSFGSFAKKRYRYNGKERDEESGLYYYGARYYATWTCRFISIDPLAGQMPFSSPYSYAANNPVVLVDVDGLAPGGGGGDKSGGGWGSDKIGSLKGAGKMGAVTPNPPNRSGTPAQSAILKMDRRGVSINPDIPATDHLAGDVSSDHYVGNGGDLKIGAWSIFLPAAEFAQYGPFIFGKQACDAGKKSWDAGNNDAIVDLAFHNPMSGTAGFIYDEVKAGISATNGDFGPAKGLAVNQSVGGGLTLIGVGAARFNLGSTLGAGKAALVPEISTQGNVWKVGAYNELRGLEKGLQAHHVGQQSLMKKLVEGYKPLTAPSILVPEIGHVRNMPGIGRVAATRGSGGFTNARQVLARDIIELRRVYGAQGIPNSALQELIQMNKTMYPKAFTKPPGI